MRSALALLFGASAPCAAATEYPPYAFFRGDCDHGVECDHWNKNGTTVCKPYEMGPPGTGALEVRLLGLPGDPTTVVNVVTYETVAGQPVINDKNYTVANQWTKVSVPMSGWACSMQKVKQNAEHVWCGSKGAYLMLKLNYKGGCLLQCCFR